MSTSIERSVAAIEKELTLLRDAKAITDAQYDAVLANLPRPAPALPAQAAAEYVEALYDYAPQQAGDLQLRTGDKVRVLEKMSPDWWKGQVGTESGVFPSNYVKPVSASPDAAPPIYSEKSQSHQTQAVPALNVASAPSQAPQQFYQQQPPQQYYQQAPPQQFYQQPLQPQQVQQVQQPEKKSSMSRFGSQLGQAVIFGAGATIGSDIVNSIF